MSARLRSAGRCSRTRRDGGTGLPRKRFSRMKPRSSLVAATMPSALRSRLPPTGGQVLLQHTQQHGLRLIPQRAYLVEEQHGAAYLRPCRNTPSVSFSAPVNEPLACPNSSDGASSFEMTLQFTATKGIRRRSLSSCIRRATDSLPVPLAPRISTDTSTGATSVAMRSTSRAAGLPSRNRVFPPCGSDSEDAAAHGRYRADAPDLRLGQIIVRTRLHGTHRVRVVRIPRHYHKGHVTVPAVQPLQQRQPVAFGQAHVSQNQVKARLADEPAGGRFVDGCLHRIPAPFQTVAQTL